MVSQRMLTLANEKLPVVSSAGDGGGGGGGVGGGGVGGAAGGSTRKIGVSCRNLDYNHNCH